MTAQPINDEGVAILHEFEDFVGHAYPDPYSPLGKELRRRGLWRKYLAAPFPLTGGLMGLSGAPWTLGWGFTRGVKEGQRMTRAEADRRLARELLIEYVEPIRRACKVEPNENQLAAMACLAWNIGMGWEGPTKPKGAKDGFRQSTVLRAHNRGDFLAASRAFGLWNKSNGEVSNGLARRRAAEANLYLKPVEVEAGEDVHDEAEVEPMPQRVDSESNLARSPIITSTTIASGTATLGVAAEAARSVDEIREGLGDWLPWILVGVAIAAGGYAIWTRVKQRRLGWA